MERVTVEANISIIFDIPNLFLGEVWVAHGISCHICAASFVPRPRPAKIPLVVNVRA